MNNWQRLRLFMIAVVLTMLVFALKARAFTSESCTVFHERGCICEVNEKGHVKIDCSAIRAEEKDEDIKEIQSYLLSLDIRLSRVEEATQ